MQLSEAQAVASVCGHYSNIQGIPCSAGINDRMIAADCGQLRTVLILDEALAFDLDAKR
ncbi:MAG: hypothetical protein HFE83_00235 [Lachnospiraceae bacterium]|nr:hypothetical protein [Lachnospiraceae bacterium]